MLVDHDHTLLENQHSPTADPFWQESWYFNFADPVSHVYGLARIGYRPSTGQADGLLLASIGGKPAMLYPAVGKRLSSGDVRIAPPGSLKTGGLEFVCQSPMDTWLLCLNTRSIDLELVFQTMTPMYMFPEVVTLDGQSAAASHYEQAGRVTGGIRCKGKTVEVNGWGQRDHSWGPRHWSGVGSWTWISAQFPSGWAFNYWSLGDGPPSKTCGFIGDGEKNMDLVGGEIFWKPTASPSMNLVLTPKGGSPRDISFKGIAPWTLFKDGAMITEHFGIFTCNGEQGAGVVERLYKPRFGVLHFLPHAPRMFVLGLNSL
ncbi:MAG: hypothetical protein JEZ02_18675 [Desulfatibacillum sp.]|nr:hypothetical protein [Desulfatibacillum sp.]